MKKLFYSLLCFAFVLSLTSCAQSDYGPGFYIDASKIPDAVPKVEPKSSYGNPESYIVGNHRYYVLKSATGYKAQGIASWYGMKFVNHKTSSGEPYSIFKMTAAHRTLPIPCYAQVTNLNNKKHIIVRVNDRGPFVKDRLIDLSYVAALKLGIPPKGTAPVEVVVIDPKTYAHPAPVPPCQKKTTASIVMQVGAFSTLINAAELQKKVQQIIPQYPCYIEKDHVKQPRLYRVKVGPIQNEKAADAVFSKLYYQGIQKAIPELEH